MAQVVRYANRVHCNRLSCNERIHAPDLPAGLFEVALDGERLPRGSLVKGQDACAAITLQTRDSLPEGCAAAPSRPTLLPR